MSTQTSMKHTVSTWFNDGQTVYEYFNTSFQRNTSGDLKFPASIVRKFTKSDGTVDVNKLSNTMAQRAIDTIVKKKFILTSVKFEWLLPEHREMLREAVCSAIQDAVLNNNVNERSTGSSINTSSFTVSQDPTGWMFTYDSFGTRTKELVELANLDKYKIVGDTFLGQAMYTNNNKGTVIVHEWNNLEFCNDLSPDPREDTLSQSISGLTAADKYDFIYLSDGSLWRFEGGTFSDIANWDRKDNVSIQGNRYLVYKDYLLVGEKGKDGKDVAETSGISWLADNYANINEFANTAPLNEMVKYNVNADGTNNAEGFVVLIRTAHGVEEFRTWAEIKTYIDNISVNATVDDGTLEDIYKVGKGETVTGSDKKYANIDELGKLMAQNYITDGEKMVRTRDNIILESKTAYHNGLATGKVRYQDTESGVFTGEYNIDITDASLFYQYTYKSAANIWNRLSAWQSAFGAKALHNETTVNYHFNDTHNYKFSIDAGQTYLMTIDDKFENNALVKYLTLKTNGQLHGANGVNHTAAARSADGYQVKLSDVMSIAHPNADIIFTFKTDINQGDTLLELDYTSAPQALVERYSTAIKNSATKASIASIANDLIQLETDTKASTEANDYEKLVKVGPITINGQPTGGSLAFQEHFGDLDTQSERQNFLDHAEIGKWYTFSIGNAAYQALVYGGTTGTSLQWIGFKEFDGANGKSMEFVKGQTTATNNADQAAPAVGEFFSNSIAVPAAYGNLQFLPKDAIVQLINDSIAPALETESDPTWRDADGTQSMVFNPSKITITWSDSGISVNENIQLILGSTAGDLVLDETIHVYPDVTTAAQNGYVAGQYKWYMYVSGTDVIFTMEDSAGSLTDTTQVISKIRRVAPRVQPMTAKYTTQQDILMNSTWIGELAKGTSKTITLPGTITIDTMTQIGLSVSGTTDWETVSGWDKVTPFYISVMTEDTSNTWWIEYKVEPVPGDKTKIKITNFISGNQSNKTQAYKAHWIHFKGGL